MADFLMMFTALEDGSWEVFVSRSGRVVESVEGVTFAEAHEVAWSMLENYRETK